jgi:hypothetical protein
MTKPSSKRMMDVEDVVIWACSQELPRKRTGTNPYPQVRPLGMNVPRSESSLIGRYTWPAGYPSISPMFAGGFASAGGAIGAGRGGPPDSDALIVEAAISGLAAGMAGLSAPEELALDLGFPVDIEGAFSGALANVADIVIVCGRLGRRPSLAEERPLPTARLAPNGKPGTWRIERIAEERFGGGFSEREIETPVQRLRKDSYPPGSYGILVWEPDPQLIVNDRAEYLVWRLALDALAASLSGRMENRAALPPAAALMPWRGDLDGDKPVELFGPGAARVYSGSERLATEARRAARARRDIRMSGGMARRPARPGRGEAMG